MRRSLRELRLSLAPLTRLYLFHYCTRRTQSRLLGSSRNITAASNWKAVQTVNLSADVADILIAGTITGFQTDIDVLPPLNVTMSPTAVHLKPDAHNILVVIDRPAIGDLVEEEAVVVRPAALGRLHLQLAGYS